MAGLLRRLSEGDRVEESIALVAAHPDDEVLGLGSRLGRLVRLKIIHLTDGAPRDLFDARRSGCSSWLAYSELRRRELRRALHAAGADRAECRAYGYPDQQAIRSALAIVERLTTDLAGMHAVVTHPYEHGHPDHDTAALVVALACGWLRARGEEAPEQFEFASYHRRDGQAVYGVFWPDPEAPDIRISLTPGEVAGKRSALACFASQRDVIAHFPLEEERVRRAPRYNFRSPAPPGVALYDDYGWGVNSLIWRKQSASVLMQLRIVQPTCA